MLLSKGTVCISSHHAALLRNISACVMVCNVLDTALGPRAASKLIVKPDGSVIVTNSGITLIQNLDINAHPAAKLIADIAQAQDKEVGDGIISLMITTRDLLRAVEEVVYSDKIHVGVLLRGMRRVEQRVLQILDEISFNIDAHSEPELLSLLENLALVALSTKYAQSWGRHLAQLAASSVVSLGALFLEHLKVMILPGGNVEDSISVAGVVVEGEVLRAPPPSSPPTTPTTPPPPTPSSPALSPLTPSPPTLLSTPSPTTPSPPTLSSPTPSPPTSTTPSSHPPFHCLSSSLTSFTSTFPATLSSTLLSMSTSPPTLLPHNASSHLAPPSSTHSLTPTQSHTPPSPTLPHNASSNCVPAPRIVLIDFTLSGMHTVVTNISCTNDINTWPVDEKLHSFLTQLVKLGISTVFSTQSCATNLFYFEQHNIGVVHLVSAADMDLLANCAGCQILHDISQFSDPSSDFSHIPIYGTVGSIEVTEQSSRFVLVRNREASTYGPQTILLRGGSEEVLAEASRGLQEAIAVIKCALINSKQLTPTSAFSPCSVSVVLGGGCVEMALASQLQTDYKMGEVADCTAARVFVKALEGFVQQLATNTGLKLDAISKLRVSHQKGLSFLGINGQTGTLVDMQQLKVWTPKQVVATVLSNAITAVSSILRIDMCITLPLAKPLQSLSM